MFRILEEDAKHFDDTEGVTCIYGIFMFLDSEQELLEEILEVKSATELRDFSFRSRLFVSFDEANSIFHIIGVPILRHFPKIFFTFDAGSVEQAEEFMLEHIFLKEDYNDLNETQKFLYNSLQVEERLETV